jgi:hypothetical protein
MKANSEEGLIRSIQLYRFSVVETVDARISSISELLITHAVASPWQS